VRHIGGLMPITAGQPSPAYDRSWDDIQEMLYEAELRQKDWIKAFYLAQDDKDKELMKDAARNKKALDGVIKTLQWTLGYPGVEHPLD